MNTVAADRLIVFTDEESNSRVGDSNKEKSYLINVATYENQVGYGPWIRINGFSENIIDFIAMIESL